MDGKQGNQEIENRLGISCASLLSAVNLSSSGRQIHRLRDGCYPFFVFVLQVPFPDHP